VRADEPFELVERDIERDDALLRAYLERIPVVTVNGAEVFEFVVDERILRDRLARVRRREYGSSARRSGRPRRSVSRSASRRASSRYLQVLTQARKMGRETISSRELADYTHVNSTQIRRDPLGVREVRQARGRVQRRLAGDADPQDPADRRPAQTSRSSGRATSGARSPRSEIFADHGFRVVAIFDNDPVKVGERVGQHAVRHNDELRAVVEEQDIVVGVLAVPTVAAQGLADDLVAAGVKIIFNYSDALLDVPPETTVHTSNPAVDLLYALYFYPRLAVSTIDLDPRRGDLRASTDFTVGLEEEFSILDPVTLDLVPRFEELRDAARRVRPAAARAHHR